MWIVTGASENHAKSLFQFLRSIPSSQHPQTFVWDLGLSEKTLDFLQNSFPLLRYRTFPFSEYPNYFNINRNAGEYAWKPTLIWKTALELGGGILLWCDAGNCLIGPLQALEDCIRTQGLYSPISAGTMRQWTHPACLEYLHVKEWMLEESPRNGAIVGFDLNQGKAWNLLEQWAALAQCKDCIAPPGSDRSNHRQDQSILSILYYSIANPIWQNSYISLLTHQDCE